MVVPWICNPLIRVRLSVSAPNIAKAKFYNKVVKPKLKEITKKEMEALLKNGVIRNSDRGFIKTNGDVVGFYRTRHRRYLEDKYVDIAKKLT